MISICILIVEFCEQATVPDHCQWTNRINVSEMLYGTMHCNKKVNSPLVLCLEETWGCGVEHLVVAFVRTYN